MFRVQSLCLGALAAVVPTEAPTRHTRGANLVPGITRRAGVLSNSSLGGGTIVGQDAGSGTAGSKRKHPFVSSQECLSRSCPFDAGRRYARSLGMATLWRHLSVWEKVGRAREVARGR